MEQLAIAGGDFKNDMQSNSIQLQDVFHVERFQNLRSQHTDSCYQDTLGGGTAL